MAGELVFERTSMTVNVAKAGVADAPGLRVSQGKAHIANLLERTVVEVNAQLDGPLNQALGVVRLVYRYGIEAELLTRDKVSAFRYRIAKDQRRESLAKRELDLATIVKARRDAQLPVTQTWIDCLCRDLGVQTFILPDLGASGASIANPLATPIGAQSNPSEGPDLPANDSGSVAAE